MFARLSLVAALCLGGAATAAPADFGSQTKIGQVSGLPELPQNLQAFYRQFQRDVRFFAAMAVNFEAEVGFYIQNFHVLDDARQAALEGCRLMEEQGECVIYAIATANTLPLSQHNADGLSAWASGQFNGVYTSKQKPGRYGAFAISGSSHQGFSWNYETREQAIKRALDECRLVASTNGGDDLDRTAMEALQDWNTCTVVHEFKPAGG